MQYFPLFADLRDRRVLVVGGGEVAERKVRLLRESGAEVLLVSRTVTPWLERTPGVTRIAAEFEPSQLDGVVFAVAATDDPGVNAQVAAAGEARGRLVNVVDDAERSSFIVPAIVDRSPLVIAISTAGAAPVLARLVRERLESLIDGSFGALAALLQHWRSRIKSALPEVAARRRFYERALHGRVAAEVRAGRLQAAESALEASLADPVRTTAGTVALVGAGPGDPGLLTLNALRALQDADVILHDRLVSDEVLALARRDATLIAVGKSAKGDSMPQARIHELMLAHARAGRRVVRLKGGDPFIFGRGGEELEFLRAHGIPFEAVPGVTAAIACGAYAGIPLTHRDHAQSVRFVTAHGRESLDRLDWASLAHERQTLALYMGVGQLAVIRQRLLEHGRSRATPIAIVENGSRPEQRVVTGTLDDLAAIAESGEVRPPALLVVGEVAALAERLHWFGPAPRRWRDTEVVSTHGTPLFDHAA